MQLRASLLACRPVSDRTIFHQAPIISQSASSRRLAAILLADAVGFSRLVGIDEEATIAALKKHRAEVFDPEIERQGGRIVKSTGDGILVEFPSAVNALSCGIAIQKAMASRNGDVPDDQRMNFRIGIHLGDIVTDGDDILGDGVNIAARLESIADPGYVVISRAVHEQVQNRLDVVFEDLGEQSLKNISRLVRAYRAVPVDSPAAPAASRPPLNRAERWSLAVLPFANLSGDPAQDQLTDGLTEDLITAFAKMPRLKVVARNSVFQFRGKHVDIPSVGRQLGVRFVLEGSVRTGGGRARVTAQLIDSVTGMHVWAERYDRDMADIFALQDDIVAAIAGQLSFTLVDVAAAAGEAAPDEDVTATDWYLRARAHWRKGDLVATWVSYRRSVERDPHFGPSLAALAFLCIEDIRVQGFTGLSIADLLAGARDYSARALAADEGDAFVQHMTGTAMLGLAEHARSRAHLENAIRLNPWFPSSRINLGLTLCHMGQHAEGLAEIDQVYAIEPRLPPNMRAVVFLARAVAGDTPGAIEALSRIASPYAGLHLMAAVTLAASGEDAAAAGHLERFRAGRATPYDTDGFARWYEGTLVLPADRARFRKGLEALKL